MGHWRAFQGPNGWYVAWEGDDGFHRQPADGGNLSSREAEEEVLRAEFDDYANREEDDQ